MTDPQADAYELSNRQVSPRGMVDHCAHARRAGETPAVSHQQLDLSQWLEA
jgi:hypothetical protein